MQTVTRDEFGSVLTEAGSMWDALQDALADLTWNYPGAWR